MSLLQSTAFLNQAPDLRFGKRGHGKTKPPTTPASAGTIPEEVFPKSQPPTRPQRRGGIPRHLLQQLTDIAGWMRSHTSGGKAGTAEIRESLRTGIQA